ncbi:MAG: stage II sporulation protein M [Anaerolineae bacterium]
MAVMNTTLSTRRHDLRMALVVTRREIRDSFRDWRIIFPIVLLTVGFPGLMNFTAQRLLTFVERYGAEVIANQLIPFLLLVVGFFPMSFSLIIALETFVGERERKSLEPLLSTPLTDTQLYMGKMIAALVPPLLASYLGMAVYMIGLYFSIHWVPSPQLFAQTILLTTVQGVIMVAGAVVASSQTTSVRAANLLASFIIVPMALLIQGEAAALFWGNHAGLWWLLLGLTITAMVLIRMGIHIFNREELMGQEIDQVRLGWMWGQFWQQFSGRARDGRYPGPLRWYKQTLRILRQLHFPAVAALIAMGGAVGLGLFLAHRYPFPPDIQARLQGEEMVVNVASLQGFAGALPLLVLLHNIRVVLLQTVLGVFTFGVLGLLVFMVPWGLIGFIAAQFSIAGEDPFAFLLATILPHALLEAPALLIAAAAALRWHAVVIAPPPERTLSEGFLMAAADFVRLFVGVVVPLLAAAAVVEAYLTPLVLVRVYGG